MKNNIWALIQQSPLNVFKANVHERDASKATVGQMCLGIQAKETFFKEMSSIRISSLKEKPQHVFRLTQTVLRWTNYFIG